MEDIKFFFSDLLVRLYLLHFHYSGRHLLFENALMEKATKRKLDILVLSDVHLVPGCHAKELLHYLKSVKPKTVILNGDIIDIWQFSKRYWPKKPYESGEKHLMGWMSKGVRFIMLPAITMKCCVSLPVLKWAVLKL